MSSGMRELIASAFGKGRGGNRICLYKDVLQCDPQVTASELRKAYHKRALLYHPDKQQQHAGTTTTTAEARIRTTTLKFQAISSAYELLRDPKKRALYDSTKRMNFDDGDDDDPSNATAPTATPSRGKRRSQDKDWVRFFQSVFEDVVTAGNDFDRDLYCGSNEEKEDVIKYYQLCKGDMKKVLSCIVQGEATTDLRRWKKDILEPAIRRGQLERLGDLKSVPTSTKASHNSSTEPTTTRVLVGKRRKIRKLVQSKKKKKVRSNPSKFNQGPSSILKATGLEDTDDEDDKPSAALATTDNNNNSNKKMSKRDKMEFRVAKKRKERREKDIELSNIIQSKGWTSTTAAAPVNTSRRAATNNNNKHGLSSSFLSILEKKFSEGSAQGNDSVATNEGKRRRKRHA